MDTTSNHPEQVSQTQNDSPAIPRHNTAADSTSSRKRSRSPTTSSTKIEHKRHDHSPKRQRDNYERKSHRGGSRGRGGRGFENGSKRNNEKDPRSYVRTERKIEITDGPKPIYSTEFSKEELTNEERRPKKRAAVLIGYCGSGYHGLQIMGDVKTIEGDLFSAFVAAGAISKANADDPRKSQLVRCARTDKGVHAAGNILSLKMIIEDEDVVKKINDNLPPQIRVWGIEQTVNSFSAYQQCDSRVYEYLIPTHCFLPPHPQTFLAKKLVELAEEAGDTEAHKLRQEDAANFWAETEEKYVKPVVDAMDPALREEAVQGVFSGIETDSNGNTVVSARDFNASGVEQPQTEQSSSGTQPSTTTPSRHTPLELAIRSIKAAHQVAKHAYRITPARLERVKTVLNHYVGTWKYHNYTVSKKHTDPSCKRHIKSFVVHGSPFIIGDTEWLSLKVHGQSFMMHQIRKMVLMAAMVVRCGTHEARIQDSFEIPKMIIPRAPALGLLLERPIFDAYNKIGRHKGGNSARNPVQFDSYTKEMDEFKQKEIYERMWRDEAEQQVFANLFGGLDSLKSSQLLWTSSLGVEAIGREIAGGVDLGRELQKEEQEDTAAGGEEG